MRDTKTVIALIVVSLTLVAALGLAVAGCGTGVAAKTGTIEVRVTDAPPELNISGITLTFSKVEVYKAGTDGEEGEWLDLGITGGTFNLLELEAADLEALLTTAVVPTGKYTQIRVTLAEDGVVVTLGEGGDPPEVTIPSGELKFVRPFDVVEGGTTTIVLDFDAAESVVVTGAGKIIFKPVVKLAIQQGGKPQELTVEGTISAVDTGASTITILPTVGDAIILNVNPQTEITLDGDPATLENLAAGQGVIAYYYLDNLKATRIIALPPST